MTSVTLTPSKAPVFWRAGEGGVCADRRGGVRRRRRRKLIRVSIFAPEELWRILVAAGWVLMEPRVYYEAPRLKEM